jgi:hypothetical protein
MHRHWRSLWLSIALALYSGLAAYQLGLPGLHYDEAAEAGVNAMQLLTGAAPTAFRDATITLCGQALPLMVQDYIGGLNVYLALPFLAFTGIGVPNLRLLSLLTGLIALLTLERAVSTWSAITNPHAARRIPYSLAGLCSVTLLAASPSFVFWSRQGIFVTNLTQPLCFWCIWQGLCWLRTGRTSALLTSALAAGLALYAKLLAIWIIGPFTLLVGGWWLWQRRRTPTLAPDLPVRLLLLAMLAFLVPLLPLLIFNWETGGTLQRITASLNQSYYGVDNRALWSNLGVRWQQLGQSLRGDHLWYLGGVFGNPLASWLAGAALLSGLLCRWRAVVAPILLLALAVAASLFTVSDLFITHYALIQPLAVAVVGSSLAAILNWGSVRQFARRTATCVILSLVLLWLVLDLNAILRYHTALTRSGGLADHSEASYHLAYYLRYNGLGAPIALDWGFAAPVRYLTQGTVTPLEIFGYTSLQQPDAQVAEQLRLFLANPDHVYLLHAPDATVFAGRREVLVAESAAQGLHLVLEHQFTQRDGVPLYELWRAVR